MKTHIGEDIKMKHKFINLVNDNMWTKALIIQLVARLSVFYVNL